MIKSSWASEPHRDSGAEGDRVEAAVSMARHGLAVLPLHTPVEGGCSCRRQSCESIGKHPRTSKGLDDASRDEDTIRRLWQRWPNANVGVRTGDGVIVLDIDADKNGFESLQALSASIGPLPQTRTAKTGGGGEHRYFSVPADIVVKNSVGRLGEGLDVRGERGYVVAPPSLHASGMQYVWTGEDQAVSPLPTAWLALLSKPALPPPGAASTSAGMGGTDALAGVGSTEAAPGVPGRRPADILAGLVDPVRRARAGARNDTLNRSAFAAGRFIAGRHIDEDDARKALLDAAVDAELPRAEIELTLNGALAAGKLATPVPALAGVQMLTDLGNAERLVERHGSSFRYLATFRQFLVWDGSRFRRDDTARIEQLAADTVRSIYAEAATVADSSARTKVVGHGVSSERANRINAMVTLARFHERVAVRPSDLDRDPWKLNVENGTIDLRTGKLQPHDPADLITKLAPVAFDPSASCPQFEAFLDVVMAGNADLISFLQRAIGYTLTGDVREQVLFLLYGTGANGKTTLVTILLSVLGDYGVQAEPELLVVRRGEVHPTGVADLVGARLAVCTEVEHGKRLAEALTKQLTGGDRITARRMRRDFFEFDPTHKLYVAANHKPIIRGTDHAIWRRIVLVPFAVTIPADKQDRELLDKLKEELPGILAWAVRGCLEWQKRGLAPPAAVKTATDAYREEMDTLADFIADCCDDVPGARVEVGKLRRAYEAWCEETGERPLGAKLFGQLLAARGYEPDRDQKTRFRLGIELRDDAVPF